MNQEPIINFDEAKKLFQKEETQSNAHSNIIPNPVNDHQAINPNTPVSDDIYTKPQKPLWKTILFWLSVAIIAFFVGFCILNAPALTKKIGYWFKKEPVNEQLFTPSTKISNTANVISADTLPDNHLIIPSINVDVPVIWNVEPSQVDDKLLEGAVQYNSSALPNQTNGNVFITAHSSNYWWIKSPYNNAFTLLTDLKTNDKIILTYQKIKYVYQVYDQFVVSPSQADVTNTIGGKSTLTLMTCVPIGTNLNRLIVRSELLYADTSISSDQTVTSTPQPQPTSTPIISNSAQPISVTPTPTPQASASSQPETKPDNLLPSVP